MEVWMWNKKIWNLPQNVNSMYKFGSSGCSNQVNQQWEKKATILCIESIDTSPDHSFIAYQKCNKISYKHSNMLYCYVFAVLFYWILNDLRSIKYQVRSIYTHIYAHSLTCRQRIRYWVEQRAMRRWTKTAAFVICYTHTHSVRHLLHCIFSMQVCVSAVLCCAMRSFVIAEEQSELINLTENIN